MASSFLGDSGAEILVFSDSNSYQLSGVTVVALGCGAAVVIVGLIAGVNAGLALESPVSAVLSSVFLSAQAYLAAHIVFSALHAVSRKAVLKPLGLPTDAVHPTVDVIIAWDDPREVEGAAFSLAAAARMNYPADKLRIHLVAAGRAANSSEPLVNLAQSYGASWLPMSMTPLCDRAMAMAFDRTAGQLVVFLRAGEAPLGDMLERVAGAFAAMPMLGYVETGRFLVDGDGARSGTANGRRMPADAGPLARALLRGGVRPSPAAAMSPIWRRGALISAGGIARRHVDGEAAARLTAVTRGWESAITPTPMIGQFAPTTIADAAQADAVSRLVALSTIIHAGWSPFKAAHWGKLFRTLTVLTGVFAPHAIVAMLMLPALAILSGTRLWGGDPLQFMLYAPFVVLATLGLSAATLSGWRHSAAAIFMDIAVNLKLAGPMIGLILGGNPLVNPRTAILPTCLAALSLAAVGFAIARMASHPAMVMVLAPQALLVLVSAILSLGALGAIREPRQKRAAPRLPSNMDAELITGGQRISGRLADISIQGARFVTDQNQSIDTAAVGGLIRLVGPHGPISLPIQLSRATPDGGAMSFGLKFTGRQLIAFANAITLVYRTQERFAAMRDARGIAPNGIMTSLKALINGTLAIIRPRATA